MADCLLVGRVGKGTTFNKPMVTKTVIFTESGTWDPPDEVVGQNIRVLCFGAGTHGNKIAGGQGGSMNIAEVRIPDKSIINVIIGAAGSGTTYFGNYVSAVAGGGSGGGIINSVDNVFSNATQFGGGGINGISYHREGKRYAGSSGGIWGGGGGGCDITTSKGGTYGGGGAGGGHTYHNGQGTSIDGIRLNMSNTISSGGTYGGNSSGITFNTETTNGRYKQNCNWYRYPGNGINTSSWTNVDKIPSCFIDNYNPSTDQIYLRGIGKHGSNGGGCGGYGGNGGNGLNINKTGIIDYTSHNNDTDSYGAINIRILASGGGGGYGSNGGSTEFNTTTGTLWEYPQYAEDSVRVTYHLYHVYGGGGGGYGGDGGDRCGGGGGYGKQAKGGYNFGGGGGYFAPGGNNGGGGGGYGPAGKGGDYGQNGGIGAGGGANNGKGGPGICIIQYQTNNY